MVSLSLGPLECEPHGSPPGLQTEAEQAPREVPARQRCVPRLQGMQAGDVALQVAPEPLVGDQHKAPRGGQIPRAHLGSPAREMWDQLPRERSVAAAPDFSG